MNCNEAKKMAERYEIEDLNYFEIKKFERHIKKCDKCKTKYKELVLLGMLFYSSKKISSPTLSGFILKYVFLKVVVGVLVFLSIAVPVYLSVSGEKEKPVVDIITSGIEINEKEEQPVEILGNKEKELKQTEDGGTRIISIYNDREVEFNVDMDDMDIKGRSER